MSSYGILYNRNPEVCIGIVAGMREIERRNLIVLHMANKKDWRTLLEGKEIDPERVVGIDLHILESFGAIIPNSVEDFTQDEILYILAKKWKNYDVGIVELISYVRKRSCAMPDITKLNVQINHLLDDLAKKGL